MAAQAELSLRSSRNPPSHIRLHAPDACMALLVVLVGTAGLIAHSWVRQVVESWINIHLLFGLLLCGWVIVRYRLPVNNSPCMLPSDVRAFARQQSRIVYLVLYAVIGVRLCIGIVSSMWHGGAADSSLFDEHVFMGPDSKAFDPKDDFQLFLASGILALLVVRVIAFSVWLRVTRNG
jgi:cytochrome b561